VLFFEIFEIREIAALKDFRSKKPSTVKGQGLSMFNLLPYANFEVGYQSRPPLPKPLNTKAWSYPLMYNHYINV
jgi:hypothetical protein